jgi:ubiquinone/menaquinone biosynthesis C-methylase UbiE
LNMDECAWLSTNSLEVPGSSITNLRRFSGLGQVYNANRPQPPQALVEVLCQMANTSRPQLVVDLGSGTGLSTFLWDGAAEAVIGIEPNADMRSVSQQYASQLNAATPEESSTAITFIDAIANCTGLPDACAEIVTCAQAFHWMEPESTLREIARLLRPGGVVAIYDYQWPPIIDGKVEAALKACIDRAAAIEEQTERTSGLQRWHKHEHLGRMQTAADPQGRPYFQMVREFWLHQRVTGTANRLVGLAHSTGSIEDLLQHGYDESDLALDQLRITAENLLGDTSKAWFFSYQVRVGIKTSQAG